MTTVGASTSLVVREDRGGRVAGLVLNRPEKLNAINREMIAELVAAVDDCVRDPSVGVIVTDSRRRHSMRSNRTSGEPFEMCMQSFPGCISA